MFTRSVFGWNSKRITRMEDRSYSVKSASATNRSASSFVRNTGNGLFIVCDLLAMHVPRADRAYEHLPIARPEHEYDQHMPILVRCADRLESLFGMGVPRIGTTAIGFRNAASISAIETP